VSERPATVNPRVLIKGLMVLLVLVAAGYAVKASGLGDMLSTDWIDTEVKGQGLAGEGLFLLVGTLAAAVGLPRQMIAFLAGYAFGFSEGTALSLVAASFGCAVAFLFARVVARDFVRRRLHGRFARADNFLSRNTFTTTVAIRLLPVGSNLLLNLAAGVASVSMSAFVAGSAVGYIPQMLIFALVGSGINVNPELRITAGVILFVVAGIIGVRLYKTYRADAHLDPAIDAEIATELAGEAETDEEEEGVK
jgi:uncharacterized membrane protein YdjX (TVP38/TMEM64 family)